MSATRKTIAIDFDGVIHRYRYGWKDGSTYDVPVDNAKASIQALVGADFSVVVFSTRDEVQIQGWFNRHMPEFRTRILHPHERFFNDVGVIGITRHKPAAFAYIDDRAIHFQCWPMALAEITHRIASEKKV